MTSSTTLRARSRSERSRDALALVVALTLVGAGAASAQTPPGRLSFSPVVSNAAFPTNIAFAPDGRAFYTEKDTGRIRVVDPDGSVRRAPFATLPADHMSEEMGLLGLALHPDFSQHPWVYAYFSDRDDGRNHLVRMRADGDVGGPPQNLLTLLPTVNAYHNGGDLAFGTDGDLYVAVGEGHVAALAQERSSLGGKILRVRDDGSIPPDNPFDGSPVYALGIRNSFGLCVDRRSGVVWETENGPNAWDELNRIEPGANYGWPDHLGPGRAAGFSTPVYAWRAVIAPTGCAVTPDGALYVGDFGGGRLHRIAFPAGSAPTDTVVATFPAGITDVATAPGGTLYVVTANAIYAATASGTGGGPFTPAGVVVLVGLIALLFLARRRLERR